MFKINQMMTNNKCEAKTHNITDDYEISNTVLGIPYMYFFLYGISSISCIIKTAEKPDFLFVPFYTNYRFGNQWKGGRMYK